MGVRPKQYEVRSRPIPYITTWTREHKLHQEHRARLARTRSQTKVQVASLSESDEKVILAESLPDNVVKDGFYWFDQPSARGKGEPQWKQVHTTRQRVVMAEMRCQVCGGGMPPPPWVWLVASTPISYRGYGHTADAPTCPTCALKALILCPRLVKGREFWLVEEQEFGGLLGAYLRLTGDGTEHVWRNIFVDHEDLDVWKLLIVGRQRLSRWTEATRLDPQDAIDKLTRLDRLAKA